MYKYRHTIFTPIYNRANELFKLYESIKELDYDTKKVEWLIVDDGSTDNIKEVLTDIMKSSDINIRCIHKENGGIHTAMNTAMINAEGEYVTRIDSDDLICKNALKDKDRILDSIPQDEKDKYIGVVGLCLNKKDLSVRGTPFPEDVMDTTGIALLRKYNLKGDRNFCMKTEIMRKYPIPEYTDTKYVPESIIWRRIDRSYLTRFVNIGMSICAEPNVNSMSGELTAKKSPGACLSAYYDSIYSVNEQKDQLQFWRYYSKFYRALLNAKMSGRRTLYDVLKDTESLGNKFIMILFAIPTYVIVWHKMRTKGKRA